MRAEPGALRIQSWYTVSGVLHTGTRARVEALTRKHACRILLTGSTLERLRPALASGRLGHLEVRWLEETTVKGKAKPLQVYALCATPPGTASAVIGGEKPAARRP